MVVQPLRVLPEVVHSIPITLIHVMSPIFIFYSQYYVCLQISLKKELPILQTSKENGLKASPFLALSIVLESWPAQGLHKRTRVRPCT